MCQCDAGPRWHCDWQVPSNDSDAPKPGDPDRRRAGPGSADTGNLKPGGGPRPSSEPARAPVGPMLVRVPPRRPTAAHWQLPRPLN